MRPALRPRLSTLLACTLVPLLAAFVVQGAAGADGGHASKRRGGGAHAAGGPFAHPSGYAQTAHLKAGPNLQPGSQPSVLPSDVLIADRNNNRLLVVTPTGRIVWQFPEPGDLAPGQTFKTPDDAFFTPNGRDIIVTEEDDYVISEVSLATNRIVWQYGHPGVPGSGPDYVDNPDDAMMLPNGDVVTADIKNCRLLVLRPPSESPVEVIGKTTSACDHTPPSRWGSPNGVFPLSDGNWIVTEINGDWVDGFDLATGKVLWSTNPPGVAYPSDTNQVSGDVYITVDYSNPGQIVEFTSSGQLVWRYAPVGSQALDQPSLALPLADGDVLLNDDWNHRVIVVDPKTDQVVWQYGHTGVPGAGPGYLYKPDGVDLVPPYSLTILHKSAMKGP
jgi:outer membrane protein assembly factor BamB